MSTQEITIRVPVTPTRHQSPNGRTHWAVKNRERIHDRNLPINTANYGIIEGQLQKRRGAASTTPGTTAQKGPVMCSKSTTPRWSAEEDQFLRDTYQHKTHKQISDEIGRSEKAVRNRCSLLSLLRRDPAVSSWSDDEIAMLHEWYQSHEDQPLQLDDLAVAMGRPKTSISRKARALGISNQRRISVPKINGRYPSRQPKFKDDAERRRHLSISRKDHIAKNGHPRGALGMRHTPETKAIIGERSRQWAAKQTPDSWRDRGRKAAMTRFKKYGHAGPEAFTGNPYSRARGGKREDLDNRYFRSSWEANYARYLNWLVQNGEIQGWEYETDTFLFEGYTRGAMTYRPDFKVTEKDGSVIYHEVKGWMDGPSKTRLKRMAKHYPEVKVIVIGEDEYRAIKKWSGLIPNWE